MRDEKQRYVKKVFFLGVKIKDCNCELMSRKVEINLMNCFNRLLVINLK